MPRIAKTLYGPALVATGPTTIYTAPALTKGIIRQIHISNPSPSPVTFTLSKGADAAGTRLFSSYIIPAAGGGVYNSVMDFFFNSLVLEPAELIQVAAGTNNILTITVMGEESVLG